MWEGANVLHSPRTPHTLLAPGRNAADSGAITLGCCRLGGSVAEWLACWTKAQKGPGSNRSCDAAG